MKSKAFWYALMAGSLLGWAFVLAGLVAAALGSPFTSVPTLGTVWVVFCIIWASHPLEIPIASWKIGKEAHLEPISIILKTLAFGFTWWLGLKKGVLDS